VTRFGLLSLSAILFMMVLASGLHDGEAFDYADLTDFQLHHEKIEFALLSMSVILFTRGVRTKEKQDADR
jgi:hypothetical protein